MQEYFCDSAFSRQTSGDYNSNHVAMSSDILVFGKRSRKPLSSSEADALDNILDDGDQTIKSSESGYFSGEEELENFNKNHLKELLVKIAEELGCCWKEAGRFLLKKECIIENINEDYSKVSEKSYQMLLRWLRENGTKASIISIFKCLNHIGKECVAEKLLDYLPKQIARECELIILMSPKKIRSESMTLPIHNILEKHKDLTVEKQLQLRDDEEIYLCSSNITKEKYLLKEIEETPKVYSWAARIVISNKQLSLKKKTLRKTEDFLRDFKFKQETIEHLKSIIQLLQEKLNIKHITLCEEKEKCFNCEKTALMRELLEKELSLLQHELVKMEKGNRRISISGIPTDRIYNLAQRAYFVCEEHQNVHDQISKMSKQSKRCSMEILDDMMPESEDPLLCTVNILNHFGRKKKVVQSLKPKERKNSSKKVQRHFSEKSKSRFYVPSVEAAVKASEPNWPSRIGSKFFPQRKRSSEKKVKSKPIDKKSKEKARSLTMDSQHPATLNHHRCNTFPLPVNSVSGPSGQSMGDISTLSGSVQELTLSDQPSMMSSSSNAKHVNSLASASDSNLLSLRHHTMTSNPFRTGSYGLYTNQPTSGGSAKKQSLVRRQRSFSNDDVNAISERINCVQHSTAQFNSFDVLWKKEIDHDTVFHV